MPLCLPECDPVLQDCEGGQICVFDDNESFFCTHPGGNLSDGEACESINQCAAGLMCADSAMLPNCDNSNVGCCTSYCDLTEPNPCLMGNECISLGVTDPAFDHVGLCGIPE